MRDLDALAIADAFDRDDLEVRITVAAWLSTHGDFARGVAQGLLRRDRADNVFTARRATA